MLNKLPAISIQFLYKRPIDQRSSKEHARKSRAGGTMCWCNWSSRKSDIISGMPFWKVSRIRSVSRDLYLLNRKIEGTLEFCFLLLRWLWLFLFFFLLERGEIDWSRCGVQNIFIKILIYWMNEWRAQNSSLSEPAQQSALKWNRSERGSLLTMTTNDPERTAPQTKVENRKQKRIVWRGEGNRVGIEWHKRIFICKTQHNEARWCSSRRKEIEKKWKYSLWLSVSRSRTRNSIKKSLLSASSLSILLRMTTTRREICRSSSLILLYWWKGHQVDLIDVECREGERRHKTFDHDIWMKTIDSTQFDSLNIDKRQFSHVSRAPLFGVRGSLFDRWNRLSKFHIFFSYFFFVSTNYIPYTQTTLFLYAANGLCLAPLECEMRQFHSLTRFAYFSNLTVR